jgi:ketosteroid isomerase-like protein
MRGFTKQAIAFFDAPSHSGLLSGTAMSLRDRVRLLLSLTGVLASVFLLLGIGHSQRPHKTHHVKRMERKQVEQLEEQWRQAMLSDDVSSMDKLLSDDYLGVTAGGDMVTKMQQLDRMRKRQITVTKLDTSDLKFKLIGQIAIVTSLAHVGAVADGKSIDGEFRMTRIYQRLASGAWKITSFESTKVSPRFGQTQTASSVPGKG